ncbi:hypothetical protein GLOIN_2v1786555 [Rhizophagus irregularis DAOM 181602=DAOM 197198]|nr:hypothetical protein GLOIN_2v1786555 [Rhizophagus irregularis DAOM 181602=DAOM 197198]
MTLLFLRSLISSCMEKKGVNGEAPGESREGGRDAEEVVLSKGCCGHVKILLGGLGSGQELVLLLLSRLNVEADRSLDFEREWERERALALELEWRGIQGERYVDGFSAKFTGKESKVNILNVRGKLSEDSNKLISRSLLIHRIITQSDSETGGEAVNGPLNGISVTWIAQIGVGKGHVYGIQGQGTQNEKSQHISHMSAVWKWITRRLASPELVIRAFSVGRTHIHDLVAKLKERFNVIMLTHILIPNLARTKNVLFLSPPLPSNSALSPNDANNILNLLRELQCEVANFHKCISTLELADLRMTQIESHLAKSFSPPKSILTWPQPPSITIASTTPHSSSLPSSSAPPFISIFSTQDEINDLKNSRVVIESNVKLRIFVIYIPPPADGALRSDIINLLIQQLVITKQAGTFHHNDQITHVDYVWSCPLLKGSALTAYIFDAHDICISDHNPVITYYDMSLLFASTKLAHARNLSVKPAVSSNLTLLPIPNGQNSPTKLMLYAPSHLNLFFLAYQSNVRTSSITHP